MTAPVFAPVDLSKYIETRLFDDRPHIRGRRLPIGFLIRQIKANNLTIAQAAYNYTLSEAAVLAALLYYEEHKQQIDDQESEEDTEFDNVKQLHGKS